MWFWSRNRGGEARIPAVLARIFILSVTYAAMEEDNVLNLVSES